MIIIRTHGGLGNQLFQIGHAMLRQQRAGGALGRVHDIRYPVIFPASPLFADLDIPVPALLHGLSRARLPKLLTRAGLACDSVRLGSARLLDGYFQRADQWVGDVPAVLADFRRRLDIVPGTGTGLLVHLRLGDFFATEEAQRAHLAGRLDAIPAGATLVSNRDDLLAAHASLLGDRGLRHQPTDRLSPEALLRLMAGFGRIESNDSTLAIWASLLGRAAMQPQHPQLAALHAAISQADA